MPHVLLSPANLDYVWASQSSFATQEANVLVFVVLCQTLAWGGRDGGYRSLLLTADKDEGGQGEVGQGVQRSFPASPPPPHSLV